MDFKGLTKQKQKSYISSKNSLSTNNLSILYVYPKTWLIKCIFIIYRKIVMPGDKQVAVFNPRCLNRTVQ